MSLREAIISELKSKVTSVSGRVYEAFLAPSKAVPPFLTVKFASQRGSNISFACSQVVEIYMHCDLTSFVTLDILEASVISTLNKEIKKDANTYLLEWTPTGAGDFKDDDRKLIDRVVTFSAVVVHG